MMDLSRLQQAFNWRGAARKQATRQRARARPSPKPRRQPPAVNVPRGVPRNDNPRRARPRAPPPRPRTPARHAASPAPPEPMAPRRASRHRHSLPTPQPRRTAPPPSVSSFNTADYSMLFGTQVSDWAGMTAIPKPGKAVRRGSTRESIRPAGLGGGQPGGEPDLVVIDGAHVGATASTDAYDTDALYAALHYYTRIGVRCVAVVPYWAFDTGLSLADKARLRTDMLRGRVMASPPTSRHDLFVRDVARRFRAYIVTNGGVPPDLTPRTIMFSPVSAGFRPRNGPGMNKPANR